jgi:hypothetical protein
MLVPAGGSSSFTSRPTRPTSRSTGARLASTARRSQRSEMVGEMRLGPGWPALEAPAPTLAYDSAVMGDVSRGGTAPSDVAGRVTAPTLVLVGGASPEWMIDVGREVAETARNGELRVLEGQEHVVPPELLAPVVTEFLARR